MSRKRIEKSTFHCSDQSERNDRRRPRSNWERQQNDRAKAKKVRAKRKKFGSDDHEEHVETTVDFLISREEVGDNIGTVAESTGGKFAVLYQDHYYECHLNPTLPFKYSRTIVVGDHVIIKKGDQHWNIEHLVERGTSLSRLRRDRTRRGEATQLDEHVIVANVDVAVIVAATKNPPFHPKFIDRYLVLVQHGGITPVICINKSDLLDSEEEYEILNYYEKIGVKVIRTSIFTHAGIDELKTILKGKRAVLVGHSGVGKSSLINEIAPTAKLRVGHVSHKGGKGRHTTTSSSLLVWENDSYIIDTPGVRSLGMAGDIEREDVQLYFDDIYELSKECRFPDCIHINVTSHLCAVVRAADNGTLPYERYESYQKILREL